MKPSKIKKVKGKVMWIDFPMFEAITLFGTVYSSDKKTIDRINSTDYISSVLESHETIHVKQAVSTKDSWFMFYLTYLWQWIKNLPLIFKGILMPYMFMEMELEAYCNQYDFNYCLQEKCDGWKLFSKLSLKDKWELAAQWNKESKEGGHFQYFVISTIKPYAETKK